MAINKVKLTSQTAWETEKQINDNFAELEQKVDEIEVPTKTSDLTNDGEDGTSPFATEEYVDENGGKIDSISVNGVAQTIDANKNVDITVPADTGATSVDETGSGNAYTGSSYDSATRKITFTKGETFQTATDNSLNTSDKTVSGAINEVNSIAKQANQAKGFATYQALITELNSASATKYNVGQSFYVQTQEVPDLWIMSVESSSSTYTYTTDAAFITATAAAGGQQVGYYKLAQLETQKVDLTNYVQKTTTIAGVDLQDNITKAELLTALNVEDGAEANTVDSVNGKTGAVVLDADDISDTNTTNKFVTATEKSTWNAKQDVVANLTFTDNDSRWSSLDANGFYTLTIVSSLIPQDVFKNGSNNLKEKVMATANYDGTNIYIVTDTKFSGSVSVK